MSPPSLSTRVLSSLVALALASRVPAPSPLPAQERWSVTLGPAVSLPAGELSDWKVGPGVVGAVAWKRGSAGVVLRASYAALAAMDASAVSLESIRRSLPVSGRPELGVWRLGVGPVASLLRRRGGRSSLDVDLTAGAAVLRGEADLDVTGGGVVDMDGPRDYLARRQLGPVRETAPYAGSGVTLTVPMGKRVSFSLRMEASYTFVGTPVVTDRETLVILGTHEPIVIERTLASFEDFPVFAVSPAVGIRF